jgi:Domain of unknown function (DUF4123)
MQQSHAHLKSMLWASEASRVFAIMDGAVVPQLQEKLGKADVLGWDCLWRGALPPDKAAVAPCLAELSQQSEFTTWLLSEAAVAYPGWGVLGVGPLNLLDMREHSRRLLQVGMPDGSTRKWTWFDPALWVPLLPKLDPMQLDEAFGQVTDWVSVTPKLWRWMTFNAGQLVVSERECLTA